ncbi:YdcF family protein [Enterococcus hirae]|nr:YdcF family protein [Enterococcus hirae]
MHQDSTAQQIQDWNQMLRFLAEPVKTKLSELSAPMLVLAGNCLPFLADEAAQMYLNRQVDQLFLVGGVGHATKYLYENFEKQGIFFEKGLSESELYARYLLEKYQIPKEALILETHSTNSGENALFALNLLKEKGFLPSKLLVMNDPTLQRRTKATFEKVWRGESVVIQNYVPFIPEIIDRSEKWVFSDERFNGWPAEYFQALVLGEMSRLKDDENGYGPKGKGYIEHIDIPETVWQAYERVFKNTDGKLSRM